MHHYSLTEYCSPDSPPPCLMEEAEVTTEAMTTERASIAEDHGSRFLEVLGAISLTVLGICVVAWLGWKLFKYFSANREPPKAIEYFPDMV